MGSPFITFTPILGSHWKQLFSAAGYGFGLLIDPESGECFDESEGTMIHYKGGDVVLLLHYPSSSTDTGPRAGVGALKPGTDASKALKAAVLRMLLASGARYGMTHTDKVYKRIYRCPQSVAEQWPSLLSSIGPVTKESSTETEEVMLKDKSPDFSGSIQKADVTVNIFIGYALDTGSEKIMQYIALDYHKKRFGSTATSEQILDNVERALTSEGAFLLDTRP